MSDVITPRRNALTRLPDWQPRLIRYVQSKMRTLGPGAAVDRSTLSRGDVVLYHQPNLGDTFGLVWNQDFLFGPGVDYMERESTIVAQKVWRV